VNEVRGGYNGSNSATTFGISAKDMAEQLGLTNLPKPYPDGNAVPNFIIAGFQQTGGNLRGEHPTEAVAIEIQLLQPQLTDVENEFTDDLINVQAKVGIPDGGKAAALVKGRA